MYKSEDAARQAVAARWRKHGWSHDQLGSWIIATRCHGHDQTRSLDVRPCHHQWRADLWADSGCSPEFFSKWRLHFQRPLDAIAWSNAGWSAKQARLTFGPARLRAVKRDEPSLWIWRQEVMSYVLELGDLTLAVLAVDAGLEIDELRTMNGSRAELLAALPLLAALQSTVPHWRHAMAQRGWGVPALIESACTPRVELIGAHPRQAPPA